MHTTETLPKAGQSYRTQGAFDIIERSTAERYTLIH